MKQHKVWCRVEVSTRVFCGVYCSGEPGFCPADTQTQNVYPPYVLQETNYLVGISENFDESNQQWKSLSSYLTEQLINKPQKITHLTDNHQLIKHKSFSRTGDPVLKDCHSHFFLSLTLKYYSKNIVKSRYGSDLSHGRRAQQDK